VLVNWDREARVRVFDGDSYFERHGRFSRKSRGRAAVVRNRKAAWYDQGMVMKFGACFRQMVFVAPSGESGDLTRPEPVQVFRAVRSGSAWLAFGPGGRGAAGISLLEN